MRSLTASASRTRPPTATIPERFALPLHKKQRPGMEFTPSPNPTAAPFTDALHHRPAHRAAVSRTATISERFRTIAIDCRHSRVESIDTSREDTNHPPVFVPTSVDRPGHNDAK